MKLVIFTIVLDGIKFLPTQFFTLNSLPKEVDWQWWCIEGVADNVLDTKWCKKVPPRLSKDGTTEFLIRLEHRHPRVHHVSKPLWHGKLEMVNHVLNRLKEPCILMEIDADELWNAEQITRICELLSDGEFNCMRFFCRYFVGTNIRTIGENSYGNNKGEWLRAWKYEPGMLFSTHEPPFLAGVNDVGTENCMSRDQTLEHGLVFDHAAYMFREQLEFKQKYYGYEDAVDHWEKLQAHQGPWPVTLKSFLPWVDENAKADLVWK